MSDLGFSGTKENMKGTFVGGFTLLELLISLAILVVILTLVMVTIRTATRTMQTVQARAPAFHAGRLSFTVFGDTLRSTVGSLSSSQGYFWGRHSMRGEVASDRIKFHSYQFRRLPGSIPGTDPLAIEWWVDEDVVLHRERSTNFGPLSHPDQAMNSWRDTPFDLTSGMFPLADQVKEFRLRYYDGSQWVNQWTSETGGDSPRAVSIDLTLQLSGSGAQTFSTVVGIFSGHQQDF